MVKKITFHVSSDGEVSLSVDGAKGSSCEGLTKPFEQVIGTVATKEFKDAYFQNSEDQNDLTQGQGEFHD